MILVHASSYDDASVSDRGILSKSVSETQKKASPAYRVASSMRGRVHQQHARSGRLGKVSDGDIVLSDSMSLDIHRGK